MVFHAKAKALIALVLSSSSVIAFPVIDGIISTNTNKPTTKVRRNFPNEVSADETYFRFPLTNGFPNSTQAVINNTEAVAGGTLPNGASPASISAAGLTSLQLIAFNEIFEVALFTEILTNVTTGVAGYETSLVEKLEIVTALYGVQAQEQLHALSANEALVAFGAAAIQPCEYNFPVDNLLDAIALAATVTDLVLGVLADIQYIFAENGDIGLVRLIGSIIGQEGEQNGFYRVFQGKRPSSQPFLTAAARDFAWTALQSFVVPGSCPSVDTVDLQIFQPLNLLSSPETADCILTFSFGSNATTAYANTTANVNTTAPYANTTVTVGNTTVDSANLTARSYVYTTVWSANTTVSATTSHANTTANATVSSANATANATTTYANTTTTSISTTAPFANTTAPYANTTTTTTSANTTTSATSSLNLVLINGQNLPIVQPLLDVVTTDGITTFRANFPFSTDLLYGLTIAVVTEGASSFSSADDVAAATVYGPVLIEVY